MSALLRVAVRLHPAPYRAEMGDELVDAVLAATAGRGRGAHLAEAASLAAHGLRLRAGLGAEHPRGRALAALVPLALGLSVAGDLAFRILQADMFRRELTWDQMEQTFGIYQGLAGVVLAALALVALLTGRVAPARALGTAAGAATAWSGAVAVSHALAHQGSVLWLLAGTAGPLLACALLWAAPLRLASGPGDRTAWSVVAAALLALVVLNKVPGSNVWAVTDLALLLAAGLAAPRSRPAALAGLVALLPLYPLAAFQLSQQTGLVFTARIEAGAALAVVTAVLVFCARGWTAPRRGRRAAGGDGPHGDTDGGPLPS
ncbi:hypothetical protein [Streptomyces mangrovisoli]|uniref:Uncharacterized protein n=1 Tax=Streptomyces mangrovisoli TaxID=1428628 RepID=A0A1J4NVY6_9ACTN|nr:hypothetical protein [Streptomyces mangrovisoli]OIJ66456.1 hypothetical protein WN71_018255 [Streptomyces mangrovisoli]